jgi:toxin CcdB
MAQFDVFANPVLRARPAYPHVVVLQSDVAASGRHCAVAPTAPRAALPAIAGRLTPVLSVGGEDFVLLLTSLTTLPCDALGNVLTSVADRREEILAAIDYLFFGA